MGSISRAVISAYFFCVILTCAVMTPTHSPGLDSGRGVGTSAGAILPQLTAVCPLEGATAELETDSLLADVHLKCFREGLK